MPDTSNLPKHPREENDEVMREDGSRERLIQNVTFFGDSAIPEEDQIYKQVWDAAKKLAQNGYRIVNGGGPGVMKAATDGAESVQGETTAIYWQPKLASFFEGRNLANVTDYSEASSNYLMRTLGLIEWGDAYVVCKGGTGTISEFGMVWALAKLYYGCHKPVILFGDFWDGLIEEFQKAMILDDLEIGVLYQAESGEDILRILQEHEQKIEHCKDKNYDGDEKAFVLSARGKAIGKEYDKNAVEHAREVVGKLPSHEQIQEFMSFVNPPAKVLDLGVGVGLDAKALSDKYKVTGIEVSKRLYEIAKHDLANVELINADMVTYDLGKELYKGVWARDSVHHLEEADLDPLFKRVFEALVPGGVFYLIVREGEGETVEKEQKRWGEIERFYHFFSPAELIERAQTAGFDLIKVDQTKRSHSWLVGAFRRPE